MTIGSEIPCGGGIAALTRAGMLISNRRRAGAGMRAICVQ
jgi:hypothetical protein